MPGQKQAKAKKVIGPSGPFRDAPIFEPEDGHVDF